MKAYIHVLFSFSLKGKWG